MINGEDYSSYLAMLVVNANVSYMREDNDLAFNSELYMATQ